MITKAYVDYIRSDRWKRKREQALAFYGRRCAACGTTRGRIHVHHLSYVHLGNEPLSDLMILCEKDHKAVTTIYRRNRRRGLRRVTMEYVSRVRASRKKKQRPPSL